MTANSISIRAYDSESRAERYHRQTGFDPERKTRMLDTVVKTLLALTPPRGNLLDLGAGTGLYTQMVLETQHFAKVTVTDGATSMLDIAKGQLHGDTVELLFRQLDFSQAGWSSKLSQTYSAVTSSMAIHHAYNKQQLFEEVYRVLEPSGVFVFADHLAGETKQIDKLIGQERGRIRLTAEGKSPATPSNMRQFLQNDAEKQAAEGNRCESMSKYLTYLAAAGFVNVDCLWRDYWLATFVAQKADTATKS